jgi:thymidine phosphorylase
MRHGGSVFGLLIMLPQEIIRRKRDGQALTREEVKELVGGLTSGAISEGQVAAFAMAVFFRGMSAEEAVGLTLAMRDSGAVLQWDLPGPIVDKHSTGGIGDNVSVMLAPMLAACGCYVPMISGRGLGHTGGTLDKLDSIPGYNTQPSIETFQRVVRETGAAIIGQTADLAPADKRLYGIRDVTATVESVPLITASILSKKLAAGLQTLVLDVKTGSGAFMEKIEEARELANSLVTVANGAGLKTTALITDMDEPLASCAGNAIEIQNAVGYLTGKHRDHRLHQVTMELASELLAQSSLAKSQEEAMAQLVKALDDGSAAERFETMVAALGGPKNFLRNVSTHLPQAKYIVKAFKSGSGFVRRIDTRAIGMAVIELGGGRRKPDDKIDHAVGLTGLARKGQFVDSKTPIATIHSNNEELAFELVRLIGKAYHFAEEPARRPPVIERITV